eukprot:1427400-Pyramimonas_sp.AAC.1
MPLVHILRQRALSSLWPHILSKLHGLGKWIPSSHKLGVNGARGFSNIDSQEDDRWVLFHTAEECENKFNIHPNRDNLREWGIDTEAARALIKAATGVTALGYIRATSEPHASLVNFVYESGDVGFEPEAPSPITLRGHPHQQQVFHSCQRKRAIRSQPGTRLA